MTADTEVTGAEAGTGNGAEAPATGAVATGKQRPTLPEGIVSPISALNTLKQRKHPEGHPHAGQTLAPQDFKPQQMYGFVKNPGKNDPFPVKHYDAAGTEFDTPQINEHGITTTRPGVKVDEVVEWWGRKGERDKQKAEAKAAKAKEKAAKDAAKATEGATATASGGQTATLEDTSGAEGEDVGADEGEFEEAE